MRCVECGSDAVSERPERTAQGYRRFRCRACGKQFNERTGTVLNWAQYPSDVIALVVLWRLRYKLSLRDLPGCLPCAAWCSATRPCATGKPSLRRRSPRNCVASATAGQGRAGRSWYVDETYVKVDGRWCYVYRAIDSSGALVDVLFSEHRDMKAARAFFRSAKTVVLSELAPASIAGALGPAAGVDQAASKMPSTVTVR